MDNNLYTNIVQICRTCMKEIIDTSFFYLDWIPLANTQLTIRQMLYSCIPEVDLSIVPNAVMCRKCVDNLLSVFEFKKNCLEAEIQINKYSQQVQHTGDLNLVEVVRFHQPNIDIELKMEDLEITENFKNEGLVCDTSAFNEANECIELFHKPDINNFDIKVKIEHLEITENVTNEDLICDTSVFNETSKCTESAEPKYLLELQKVDTEDVLFNTFDDYNSNYNLSAAEENPDAHNSSIAQNCLSEAIEHQDNYSRNLNETNAYYQCCKCGHKAESKLKLILHLKHHTQKNFYNKEIISRTLSRYHKNLICFYRCSLCNYLTRYKCLFDFHIRIHLIKKNYKHFYKLKNVNTKAFHTTIKVSKTNIKGNERKLVKNCNNYYKHNFKNRSRSKISKQHLSHRNGLKGNMKALIVEKLFKCSICEYQFGHKSSLKRHMLIHTGEKPFSCSVCEYQCNLKNSLKTHMLIHTGEKSFSCSVCKYQCSRKGDLKKHMPIHTGEKPFSCSVCEYQCRQKSALKRHILIHTGDKPFSCSFCKFQCSQKSHLKRHMLIHTGEKPFLCSVCECQFSTKSKLKRHILIHTGEKPFSCSFCKFQCSQKSDLRRHILIHTGEKPFSCSFCKYQCSQKSYLKRHILIHTGEKPFSCFLCEYQCNHKSSLKRHMQSHT